MARPEQPPHQKRVCPSRKGEAALVIQEIIDMDEDGDYGDLVVSASDNGDRIFCVTRNLNVKMPGDRGGN